MPSSSVSGLTPAHRLLHLTWEGRDDLALDAWLESGLTEARLTGQDGHTDLTAFLLRFQDKAFDPGRQEIKDLEGMMIKLIKSGSPPFVKSADGLDGFDEGAWIEGPVLAKTWIEHLPPHLSVDAVMGRTPKKRLGRWAFVAPTHWADWARHGRGQELLAMRAAGGQWPSDILGWAQPKILDSLLKQGASWNQEVQALWEKRLLSGEITAMEMEQMLKSCSAGGDGLDRISPHEMQALSGQAFLKLLRKTDDRKNWDKAWERVQDKTAPRKTAVKGTSEEEWPIAFCLMSLLVEGVTRRKESALFAFINDHWRSLTSDVTPATLLPNTGHTMGDLAWGFSLFAEQQAKINHNDHSLGHAVTQLKNTLHAWAPFPGWTALAKIGDAVMFEGIFPKGSTGWFVDGVNNLIYNRALGHVSDELPPVDSAWLKSRLQSPGGSRGLWGSQKIVEEAIDAGEGPYHRKSLAFDPVTLPLIQSLTPEERLRALMAYTVESQFNWPGKRKMEDYLTKAWRAVASKAEHEALDPWVNMVSDSRMAAEKQTWKEKWTAMERSEKASDLGAVGTGNSIRRTRARP